MHLCGRCRLLASAEQLRNRPSLSVSAATLSTLYAPALSTICGIMDIKAQRKASGRGTRRQRKGRRNLHYFDRCALLIGEGERSWLSACYNAIHVAEWDDESEYE